MNCKEIMDLTDQYLSGELDQNEKCRFEEHINACSSCALDLENSRILVNRLRALKTTLRVKDDILNISRRNIMKKSERFERKTTKTIPVAIACVLLVLFTLTSSFIAFPALASKYAPELPVVKELLQVKEENKVLLHMKDENTQIMQKLSEMEKENEKLKMQIKEIAGEKINEVQTSTGIAPEDNTAIQELVIGFIKAQYASDLAAMKAVSTESYIKKIDAEKARLFKNGANKVVFSQITNVAREGDSYWVFVRLQDSLSDSQYQENFEVKKINGKFLINTMELDA